MKESYGIYIFNEGNIKKSYFRCINSSQSSRELNISFHFIDPTTLASRYMLRCYMTKIQPTWKGVVSFFPVNRHKKTTYQLLYVSF